jgi:NAD(P)H-flavin reductase
MNAAPTAMAPAPARVVGARRESHDVVTLTIDAGGERPFSPGQFNMLYAFGVGESAISMSGDPGRSDVHVHTIRAVGPVTDALCRLERGGLVGVRGPFGSGWPTNAARGADLLLVAGGLGLAPLRPAVYDALARRSELGRVSLLVGARTPEDMLFSRQLERWRRAGIDVLTTVDRADASWTGRVGVVTALLSEIDIAADRTVAFVCGPETMMRFTVRDLARRGVPDERMFLAMERNMKCALGFCGHCQLGPSFICMDGPVLPYDRLRRFFWVREA